MEWKEEEKLYDKYGFVAGTDEAGRGPLAGPVFAAAVILPPHIEIKGLNDSKKLSPKVRDRLFDEICEKAVSWCVASSDVEEIERVNILEASQDAMRRAVAGLSVKADAVIVDGNIARGFDIPAFCLIGGDAISPSVAAASVLAKVSRDRYCLEMDKEYPQYGFAVHKGYGTKAHRDAIFEYGPCPLHRLSFLKKMMSGR